MGRKGIGNCVSVCVQGCFLHISGNCQGWDRSGNLYLLLWSYSFLLCFAYYFPNAVSRGKFCLLLPAHLNRRGRRGCAKKRKVFSFFNNYSPLITHLAAYCFPTLTVGTDPAFYSSLLITHHSLSLSAFCLLITHHSPLISYCFSFPNSGHPSLSQFISLMISLERPLSFAS